MLCLWFVFIYTDFSAGYSEVAYAFHWIFRDATDVLCVLWSFYNSAIWHGTHSHSERYLCLVFATVQYLFICQYQVPRETWLLRFLPVRRYA